MMTLLERPRRAGGVSPRWRGGQPAAHAAGSPDRPFFRWVVLLVLAAGLIFAHGCHAGDHDDELAAVLFDRR
jgi:hypothetical protein